MESEQRRREMAQVYNSYRAARSQYAVEDIPMPDSMEGEPHTHTHTHTHTHSVICIHSACNE